MNVAEFVSKRLHGLTASPTLPTAIPSPVIGTHDGSFHCDEAMACGLLRHTSHYANSPVVRTRVNDVLKQCNIVVDVGGVYDPASGRFDHHQPEFTDKMHTGIAQYNTRLSSAGLVYKHFGQELIKSYVDACVECGALSGKLPQNLMDLLYDRVYKGFMEHVDGIDNGVEEFSLAANSNDAAGSLVKNYSVPTTLSARVGRLYPRWNDSYQRADEDAAFVAAVNLTTLEFFEAVDFYACSWIPARAIVERAFDSASAIHSSQQIISLESAGAPWKEHLLDVEKERGCVGRTLYVLFGDAKGWRVQAVPKENSAFQNRKSLPWKGLRDDDLSKASGVDGGVFVHVSGFIGGNKTMDGAKQMAIKALEIE